ncbi:hypothetical protein VTN77DRAFT_6104 [Rasamsonia byssochlamydoides]|uniref:uncharacterized protein n=1 Tax=Rasamsonia byssochlamydoides TaxID=89139 RepID=UPI003743263A
MVTVDSQAALTAKQNNSHAREGTASVRIIARLLPLTVQDGLSSRMSARDPLSPVVQDVLGKPGRQEESNGQAALVAVAVALHLPIHDHTGKRQPTVDDNLGPWTWQAFRPTSEQHRAGLHQQHHHYYQHHCDHRHPVLYQPVTIANRPSIISAALRLVSNGGTEGRLPLARTSVSDDTSTTSIRRRFRSPPLLGLAVQS